MVVLADTSLAVAQVPIDAPAPGDVVAIVGTGERGPLGDAEVRFDGVEPGRLGRSPHGLDMEAAKQRQEARVIVDVVQIIHDDEQAAARVARPQTAKGLAHLDDPLASAEEAAETIGMDIVEPQKLLGAFGAAIGGAYALGPPTAAPGDAAQRLELQ